MFAVCGREQVMKRFVKACQAQKDCNFKADIHL